MKKIKILFIIMLLTATIFLSGCIEDEDIITKEEILQQGKLVEIEEDGDIHIIAGYENVSYCVIDYNDENIYSKDSLENISSILTLKADDDWDRWDYEKIADDDYIGAEIQIYRTYQKIFYKTDGCYKDNWMNTDGWWDNEYHIIRYNFTYRDLYFAERQHFYDVKNNFTSPENISVNMSDSIDKYGAGIYTVYNITVSITSLNPWLDIDNFSVSIDKPDHLDPVKFQYFKPDILQITMYGSGPGKYNHGTYTVELICRYPDWRPLEPDRTRWGGEWYDSRDKHLEGIGSAKLLIDLGICKKPVEI